MTDRKMTDREQLALEYAILDAVTEAHGKKVIEEAQAACGDAPVLVMDDAQIDVEDGIVWVQAWVMLDLPEGPSL